MHHGNEVWVNSKLKGRHREACLCHNCLNLNMEDRTKNCKIAAVLYENAIKFKLVTPVFECPSFRVKNEF